MKLYIQKFEKQTVVTGKIFSIDIDLIRETYDEFTDASDETIIEALQNDSEYLYDMNECETAVSFDYHWTSAENGEDSEVDICTESEALERVKFDLWGYEYPHLIDMTDANYKQKFLNDIPEIVA